MKIILILMATLLISHNIHCQTFEVRIDEGIYMKFKVLDSDKKTVQVGYGNQSNGAIPKTYSGNVSIPASVTYNNEQYMVSCIGDFAFNGCVNLANVTIPNGVKIISDYAFSGCSSLSNIDIPNSVTTIGAHTFWGCENFTMITIPESVTSIGSMAFSGELLSLIEIPNSVTYIGDQAFDFTSWYNNFIKNVGDGMVYLGKVAYRYKGKIANETEMTLKEGTTCISGHAFYEQSGLTSIIIPSSVSIIDSEAFAECTNLISVDIPQSVSFIGNRAFDGCSKLRYFIIPDGLTIIEWATFRNCSSLETIQLSNSVKTIGDQAFANCQNLRYAILNQGIATIGGNAFQGCISLDSIFIPNTVNTIEAYAFSGCYKLETLIFEDGNNELNFNRPNGKYVLHTFDDCHINKLYLGRTIYYYPLNCSPFHGCSIDTLIIGTDIVSKDPYRVTSSQFDGLRYVEIKEKVTSIPNLHFPSLEMIVVDESNPMFDSRDNCNAVIETKTNTLVLGYVNTKIPNSIEAIGNEAFLGCGLKNIDIPQGVQKIGSYAFSCPNLETIRIPKSVVYIGEESFSQCSSLKEFYCYDMPRTFASNIFARTNIGNATLYVPSSLIDAFKIVSPWKEFGTIVPLTDEDAYSGDSRSPIPMISVHSVGDLLYRRQN